MCLTKKKKKKKKTQLRNSQKALIYNQMKENSTTLKQAFSVEVPVKVEKLSHANKVSLCTEWSRVFESKLNGLIVPHLFAFFL